MFGSKSVCACDLKLFLPTMEQACIDQFFQRTLQLVKFDEQGTPIDVSILCTKTSVRLQVQEIVHNQYLSCYVGKNYQATENEL